MKYNKIEIMIQDSYNNPDINTACYICELYGYTRAKKILNHSKNIIDGYINLLTDGGPDLLTPLLMLKEIIFLHTVSSYTKREGEPAPSLTEPTAEQLARISAEDMERLKAIYNQIIKNNPLTTERKG